MSIIFSKEVNKYLVVDFIRSLSRDTQMISPSIKKWRPENNSNLVSVIEFGKSQKIPRHEKEFKKCLTNI